MKPSWIPYAGPDEVLLALALGMVTAVAVFAAVGIRRPFLGPSASRGLVVMLVVAWLLAILTFLVDVIVYELQARQVHLPLPSPPNHVTPVTLTCAALSFVAVAVLTPARLRTRLGNGLLCACLGPMVFELPFDLIVMGRTTAVPPVPDLFRALFFLPLFAIEVLTIALAATRPGVQATRWTAVWLAGMFIVFTMWALIGFQYPFDGLALAANIVSKILAFATALSLFIRHDSLRLDHREQTASPPRTETAAVQAQPGVQRRGSPQA
ncbi:MAG: hypothetical protein HIU86_04300 [Acidobacteria bacterium]|nr:hypothetical protein [Acidobacteriota bacterium]